MIGTTEQFVNDLKNCAEAVDVGQAIGLPTVRVHTGVLANVVVNARHNSAFISFLHDHMGDAAFTLYLREYLSTEEG